MSDLKQLIVELSKREITRKQFLIMVGGSFLGMIGIFRVLQSLSTPDLATGGDKGGFGEKEYGHPVTAEAARAKGFSEDAFG